jgi:NADH-quinone oxidoreductase subunit A
VAVDTDVAPFLPVLLYALVVVGFAAAVLFITTFLPKPNRHTPAKDMPYESGMDPEGDARKHFDVKFYLMAILFLVFDVELLFLYPWAVTAFPPLGTPRTAAQLPAELSGPVFVVMLVFLATLFLGYVYAWRKGVFRWR